MFEINGWKSYCLGANTKTSELLRLIGETKPDLLALSVSLYLNILRFQKVVEEVHFKFPDLEIIAGGKAFQNIKEDFSKKYPYLQVINSIQDLEKFIRSYKIKEKTSI
ncbi:MAG: cobalamin-dependent protein, partial [Syntrophothermus sp.]